MADKYEWHFKTKKNKRLPPEPVAKLEMGMAKKGCAIELKFTDFLTKSSSEQTAPPSQNQEPPPRQE